MHEPLAVRVPANLCNSRTFKKRYSLSRMAENPTRVEAFSDGVFAIAITLLILEIRVPHVDPGLWTGLLALWPSYVAFLLSFVVILIMWVNHHELLRMVDGISYPFLFANGLLLLTVTFVPFPTAVLAAHLGTPEAKTAVALYCGMFVVNALCWNVLFATIVRSGLLHRDVTAEAGGGGPEGYHSGAAGYGDLAHGA